MTGPATNRKLRVALVHDWLVARRGGENVLAAIAPLFPEAPIFTLVHRPGAIDPLLERHPIRTSFIQKLPGAPTRFRHFLPLFPRAVEAWDFSSYDLVVSTSHCVAMGVRTRGTTKHLSYIHTPMRYLRDQLKHYVPSRILVPVARAATFSLRRWEHQAAQRPDQLLCNSLFVSRRIACAWQRQATVIYPPVDVDFFQTEQPTQRCGYLVVSALVPYKRVDLAVAAANALNLDLTVIGEGPERRALQRLAGPTVTFRGWVTRPELRKAYATARALLFPSAEDFGIVPVEAAAAGCPTLALARGGALESLSDGVSGLFFDRQAVDDLVRAIAIFENRGGPAAFDRRVMGESASRFAAARFRRQMGDIVTELVGS